MFAASASAIGALDPGRLPGKTMVAWCSLGVEGWMHHDASRLWTHMDLDLFGQELQGTNGLWKQKLQYWSPLDASQTLEPRGLRDLSHTQEKGSIRKGAKPSQTVQKHAKIRSLNWNKRRGGILKDLQLSSNPRRPNCTVHLTLVWAHAQALCVDRFDGFCLGNRPLVKEGHRLHLLCKTEKTKLPLALCENM